MVPAGALRFLRLQLYSRAAAGLAGAMERAVVRCVPAEPKLILSLVVSDGSARNLQRDREEPLGRALARIAVHAAKGWAKAAKKGRKGPASREELPLPAVRLFSRDGEAVADDVPNTDAWQDGAVLQIGDITYRVERNPPMLTELHLPRSLLAGFPVCPKLATEFTAPHHCLFRWFCERPPSADGAQPTWVDVEGGDQQVFVPSNVHVGQRLKLHCTPHDGLQRYGVPREVESMGPVEAGPGACTFDARHLYTRKLAPAGSLRAVSYNVLADTYAQTEFSRTVLFPYCAPYALELDYRQSLLHKELAGYHADLMCLQEVDQAVFTDSLGPALEAFGLKGLFKIKEKQREGLATFYRQAKLQLLSQHDLTFSQALQEDPLHRELQDKLATYPVVQEKVLQRSSVLQVSVLQSTNEPSRKICVANTHLYWHPKGGNIRLIQAAVALSHIRHIACELYPGIPIIFCGDFNSTPSTGLYHFVSSGSIDEHHEDWVSSGEEEKCSMSLTHPFKLQSACGEPAYTNYVGGFHGCLDYIFIDAHALEVEQVIPLPSHEEVTTHQALPSVSHPSDHIALICDLKWK
ncbi:PREDICTED: 2',5'-phosphodiesterase 12 [Crocodylus porosus]|uniref:2',5'-phosphodiesterase 12 n=1 Tax=Crocodylus porosus TaxID=8502 RepID=A0A7M4FMN8_CROPO|nr:PREDICTED: 2',5'-phosphodiesterase 12 [Crocodylus porosus]